MQTKIVVRRRTLFGNDPLGIDDANLEAAGTRPMVDVWRWPLKTSTPERAILEALDELPRNATFEHLDKVFEGLVSLRPRRLTELLTACRSVKVRRGCSSCSPTSIGTHGASIWIPRRSTSGPVRGPW